MKYFKLRRPVVFHSPAIDQSVSCQGLEILPKLKEIDNTDLRHKGGRIRCVRLSGGNKKNKIRQVSGKKKKTRLPVVQTIFPHFFPKDYIVGYRKDVRMQLIPCTSCRKNKMRRQTVPLRGYHNVNTTFVSWNCSLDTVQ